MSCCTYSLLISTRHWIDLTIVSIVLLLFPLTGKFQVVIQKLWPNSRVAVWRTEPHAWRALVPFWKQLKRHWGFCPLAKKLTNFKLGPWKKKPSPAGLALPSTEPNGLSAVACLTAVSQMRSTQTCEVVPPRQRHAWVGGLWAGPRCSAVWMSTLVAVSFFFWMYTVYLRDVFTCMCTQRCVVFL